MMTSTTNDDAVDTLVFRIDLPTYKH